MYLPSTNIRINRTAVPTNVTNVASFAFCSKVKSLELFRGPNLAPRRSVIAREKRLQVRQNCLLQDFAAFDGRIAPSSAYRPARFLWWLQRTRRKLQASSNIGKQTMGAAG